MDYRKRWEEFIMLSHSPNIAAGAIPRIVHKARAILSVGSDLPLMYSLILEGEIPNSFASSF